MNSDYTKKGKTWYLVALEVSREAEEFAGSLLFEFGTSGVVTLEENKHDLKLGGYFDERAEPEEIAQRIETEFARAGHRDALLRISISKVPDQDWMQKWKEGFEPIEVGRRLVIAPSWKLPASGEGRAVIQIDPGMAFGTGTHETTRLCLEAIEQFWGGGRLLDVGTGTGILAIAAALLQPQSRITAIDIDPQAVEVARENIAINGVSASIHISEGQPRDFAGKAFDMVVANLTAEALISLMRDLVNCVAPTGLMILSGILTYLSPDVEAVAGEAGLEIIDRREEGEWSTLVARVNEGRSGK